MSEDQVATWEKVEEDGNTFWVHMDHGNVFKQSETSYIAMVPKVVKFGPFKTLEEAQKVLETCKQDVSQALDILNDKLIGGNNV
jgi:hypothetical protein